MTDWVRPAHAYSTLAMVGVIWFVQLVHYPLFAGVATDGFAAYEREHQRRTTWVVLPLMLVELATAAWLAWTCGSAERPWAFTGVALVALCWGSTFFLQVPLHESLAAGFDVALHRRLVATNWLRTAVWTVRGAIALTLMTPR